MCRLSNYGFFLILLVLVLELYGHREEKCSSSDSSSSDSSSDSSSSSDTSSDSESCHRAKTPTKCKRKTTTRCPKTTTTRKTTTTTTKTHNPVCCGAYEELRECVNICNINTCGNRQTPKWCLTAKFACKPGFTCDCIDGYRRNDWNLCVPWDECDEITAGDKYPKCGPNETSDGCVNTDDELTCENYNDAKKKKKQKDGSSNNVCRLNVCHCKRNYVRNKYDVCVHHSKCKHHFKKPKQKPCRDPYAVRKKYFKKSTANLCVKKKYSHSYLANEKTQRNVCDCRDGYLQNDFGVCVLKKHCKRKTPYECTNPCHKKNEIYRCFNPCDERRCGIFATLVKCKDECYGHCDCEEGFRRDPDTGDCVRKCPTTTQAPATTQPPTTTTPEETTTDTTTVG